MVLYVALYTSLLQTFTYFWFKSLFSPPSLCLGAQHSAGDDVEQKHAIVKKHFIYHKSELCCQPTVIALTGSAAGSLSL